MRLLVLVLVACGPATPPRSVESTLADCRAEAVQAFDAGATYAEAVQVYERCKTRGGMQ